MSWTGALLALLLLLAGWLVLRAVFLTYRVEAAKRGRLRDDLARSAGGARAVIASPMIAAEQRWSQVDAELAARRRAIDLTATAIDLTEAAQPAQPAQPVQAAGRTGPPAAARAAAAAQAQQRARAVAAATRRGAAAAASSPAAERPPAASVPASPGRAARASAGPARGPLA